MKRSTIAAVADSRRWTTSPPKGLTSMNLPAVNRSMATDVARLITALVAIGVCALVLGYLIEASGAMQAIRHCGQTLQERLDPSLSPDESF
ncbi:hypothetical protein [Acidisarcina polymorpha]|uniref:hypothetical protein n=1 Tax=Acidisarcina polymorpha TaxID=2211140 RepID=UPI000DEFFFF0|nr:hypothetical protein [Acidisarcina polymorpha]